MACKDNNNMNLCGNLANQIIVQSTSSKLVPDNPVLLPPPPPPQTTRNRWERKVNCTVCVHYVSLSLIRIPRLSGYFRTTELCAVKRALTIYLFIDVLRITKDPI